MCEVEAEFRLGRDTDFDLVEAASVFDASGANPAYTGRGGFEVETVAEPSVAQARRAAERVGGFAAKDYRRMRFLDWPRLGTNPLDREEPAMECRSLHRPQGLHQRDRFLRALALMVKRHPHSIILALDIADADAEDEPPIREHVDRSELLG